MTDGTIRRGLTDRILGLIEEHPEHGLVGAVLTLSAEVERRLDDLEEEVVPPPRQSPPPGDSVFVPKGPGP